MKLKQRLYNNKNNYIISQQNFNKFYNLSINSFPYESILNLELQECNTPISIIIPCWNTEDIIYTLKSIEWSTFNKKFHKLIEIIIVDDGSNTPIKILLDKFKFYLNIKLIRQKHLGRAYAINTGVAHCTNENIIFCDSDIILLPTTIEQLVARMPFVKNNILFGFRNDITRDELINNFDNLFNSIPKFYEDNRFCYDFNNSWSTNMMQETNFLQNYNLKNNFWVSDEKKSIDDCWQSFRMVYGFLFTTTKSIFNKLGGFDERLSGWGWDDSIYCAKALSQNVNIIPVSAAHCLHINHLSRTKNQWDECKQNFKIVKKNLNANYLPSFNNIKDNRIEYITSLKKSKKTNYNYTYKTLILKALTTPLEKFRYFYNLGEFKKAISIINSTINLNTEDLNNYIDCILRTQNKELFNKLNNKRCSNCFNYYIGQIFFYNNFDLSFPTVANSKNFFYLNIVSKQQHKKRGHAFLKQNMYFMAFKDYCASYVRGCKNCKSIILKIKNILLKNQ